MKGLTRRQQEVLDVIRRMTEEQGYPPSMREITARMKLSSAAGIHKHIKALEKKGALSKADHLSRSLKLPGEGRTRRAAPSLVELPLAGTIAAGQPIEAIAQQEETLTVPVALLGKGPGDPYVLRVRGDSMVDEGILDGDYVIVASRQPASNGEVVVALLGGGEATLKRFYRENGRVRLQPANPDMQPILIDRDDLRMQGVVIGLWRPYR